MLKQYSRRAVVTAALQDDPELAPLAEVLEPAPSSIDCTTGTNRMTSAEEAAFFSRTKGCILSPPDLKALSSYLNTTGRPHRSFDEPLPFIANDVFLSPLVKLEYRVQIDKRTYSADQSHDGNSGVRFRSPSTAHILTGNIIAIWTKPIHAKLTTFFVVRAHKFAPKKKRWHHSTISLKNIQPEYSTQTQRGLCRL